MLGKLLTYFPSYPFMPFVQNLLCTSNQKTSIGIMESSVFSQKMSINFIWKSGHFRVQMHQKNSRIEFMNILRKL